MSTAPLHADSGAAETGESSMFDSLARLVPDELQTAYYRVLAHTRTLSPDDEMLRILVFVKSFRTPLAACHLQALLRLGIARSGGHRHSDIRCESPGRVSGCFHGSSISDRTGKRNCSFKTAKCRSRAKGVNRGATTPVGNQSGSWIRTQHVTAMEPAIIPALQEPLSNINPMYCMI